MRDDLRKNIEKFIVDYENDISTWKVKPMDYYVFDVDEANSLLKEAVELLTQVVN